MKRGKDKREVASAFRADCLADQASHKLIEHFGHGLETARYDCPAARGQSDHTTTNDKHLEPQRHHERRVGEGDIDSTDFERDDRVNFKLFKRACHVFDPGFPVRCAYCAPFSPLLFRFSSRAALAFASMFCAVRMTFMMPAADPNRKKHQQTATVLFQASGPKPTRSPLRRALPCNKIGRHSDCRSEVRHGRPFCLVAFPRRLAISRNLQTLVQIV